MPTHPRRALVSVNDKTGLVPFVTGLVELGFQILSTGGTSRTLKEAGLPVTEVSEYTQFPEIMAGRVKTLHPRIHGAILGRPDRPEDAGAMSEHGIIPFELVVCNLYPFEQTIAREGVTVPEAIEQIDIGGPSMIRSAAKNHAYIGVVTSASQYEHVLTTLRSGELTLEDRRELAGAAFEMTARYDQAIANYFVGLKTIEDSEQTSSAFPEQLTLSFERKSVLRYGENPHQGAAFYVESSPGPATVAAAEQRHGKELSYNNLLDLDAALAIVREFSEPAAVVIKHNNPCGCAIGDTLDAAFVKAYEGDPISAFGSIISFNRSVDTATAEQLCEPGRFIEAIIAPGFDETAFEMLTTRPKWKNNVRLMSCPGMMSPGGALIDFRRVAGGLLVQDRDDQPDPTDEWQVVTERKPTEAERIDLAFAWKVCKHVKSNAILLAKEGAVLGVGAGQMSRLDSSFIAAHKAGERSQGAVVASDAFFPFRDGVDEAAKAGVRAVIQPGGSRQDEEVIAACNEHGMAMIFTGRRHFKH
ncbi:MAG: bifunctional phosphoribosylaminoimidazolecarboxamide formyltransferase/IMP cyclohydrolase [Planctomycetaceae bacterium]|nr:bifunctional phosphoribosylaminoimidazolecarboxamide formyltransferase/IMP cyclohydrolase [Planctomycetaceae bacterium]